MKTISKAAGTRTLSVLESGNGQVTANMTANGKTGRYVFKKVGQTPHSELYTVEEVGGGFYCVEANLYEPAMDTCTCTAAVYGNRCKHVDACVVLTVRGKFD